MSERFAGVGDDFAGCFEELYRVAYRAAYGILGDRAEAEDCAQEATARALVRWRRVHDYAPAFVARVSVNLALDRVRATKRAIRMRRPSETPADRYELAARRRDLATALAALPKRRARGGRVEISGRPARSRHGGSDGVLGRHREEHGRPWPRQAPRRTRTTVGVGRLMKFFDELHDPNPPEPGMHEFAIVAERARGIRQQRITWASRAASLVIVAGAAIAVYQVTDRTTRRHPAHHRPVPNRRRPPVRTRPGRLPPPRR